MNYYPVKYTSNLINKNKNRIQVFCSFYYKEIVPMTNEQLTTEVIKLMEHQAKSEAEHDRFELILKELQEDVRTTKTLAEDIHILAINMENLKESQEQISKKVDALTSKEFMEYKENKKLIRQNLVSGGIGAIITAVVTLLSWLLTQFFKGGN